MLTFVFIDLNYVKQSNRVFNVVLTCQCALLPELFLSVDFHFEISVKIICTCTCLFFLLLTVIGNENIEDIGKTERTQHPMI